MHKRLYFKIRFSFYIDKCFMKSSCVIWYDIVWNDKFSLLVETSKWTWHVRCMRKCVYPTKPFTFSIYCSSLLHSIFKLILLVSITFSLYLEHYAKAHTHSRMFHDIYIPLYSISCYKLCSCIKTYNMVV